MCSAPFVASASLHGQRLGYQKSVLARILNDFRRLLKVMGVKSKLTSSTGPRSVRSASDSVPTRLLWQLERHAEMGAGKKKG